MWWVWFINVGGAWGEREENDTHTGLAMSSAEGIECPVCFSMEEDVLVTKCKHKFCRPCVVRLLKESFQATTCPVCRQRVSMFDITRLATGKALLEQPTTIFGGVYIQGNTEGLASYHFSEEESYISYSAAPSAWRLDDGSAPPLKKPFLNSTYDPTIRTFRAIVDWSSVNFGGDAKWIYRMVFSEDFATIESGEVLGYGPAGEKRRWTVYMQGLFYTRQIKELESM